MSAQQRAKYLAICSLFSTTTTTSSNSSPTSVEHITKSTFVCNDYSDGSSVQRTADMVLLLSRVCFDEQLVSVGEDAHSPLKTLLPSFTPSPYGPYAPYPVIPYPGSSLLVDRMSGVVGGTMTNAPLSSGIVIWCHLIMYLIS
jgi:hypothetical protein